MTADPEIFLHHEFLLLLPGLEDNTSLGREKLKNILAAKPSRSNRASILWIFLELVRFDSCPGTFLALWFLAYRMHVSTNPPLTVQYRNPNLAKLPLHD